MNITHLRLPMIALVLLLAVPITKGSAQSTSEVNSRPDISRAPYTTWVKPVSEAKKIKGYLLYLDDEVIGFRDHSSLAEDEVPVVSIEALQFRPRGRGAIGKITGALSGAFLGALLGAAIYNSSSNGGGFESLAPLLMPVVGVPLGFIAGGAIAVPKETVHLYGNPAVYEQERGDLVRYTLKF